MSLAHGRIIDRRMNELDLTNERVANLIHVSETTVRNMRRGDIETRSFETVTALCNALGIPVDAFAQIDQDSSLSQEEMDLILKYRNAAPYAKQATVVLLTAASIQIACSTHSELSDIAKDFMSSAPVFKDDDNVKKAE